MSAIPQAFLLPTFNLSQSETFLKVFPFIKESGLSHVLGTGKTLQEKLSYYLDLIEMQIAHQISHKSDDFFQAVASHDAVREELGKALTAVKALRLKVNHVDVTHVQGSLKGTLHLIINPIIAFIPIFFELFFFQFCNAKFLDRIMQLCIVN